MTDAINGLTGVSYDPNGNLLTVTDVKSQQTVYAYRNMDRVATRKDPLLRTETYGYDNNGNLSTVLDRKSHTTAFTYDPLNRRTKATYHDGTSTNHTYDAGNRLTQIQEKDSDGTVTATITRIYDDLDRLTNETTAQGSVISDARLGANWIRCLTEGHAIAGDLSSVSEKATMPTWPNGLAGPSGDLDVSSSLGRMAPEKPRLPESSCLARPV